MILDEETIRHRHGDVISARDPRRATRLRSVHGSFLDHRRSGVAILIALLACVRPDVAVASFAVGNFTKSTSGAPATQNVAHGLGETPKAIILWTIAKTSATLGADYRFGFGFSDGTNDKSVASSSLDNVNPTSSSRRIANKVITIVDPGGTVSAEADLQSMDATNFTLSWTTNNATAYRLHFIAIGGRRISSKVFGWTMRTSTGNQAVTGVGFKPDVVIHAHVGSGFTSSPPATSGSAALGLSAMDVNGGEWANALFSTDGASSSDAQRYQRNDQSIVAIGGSLSKTKEASFVSMDSDGFTMNYSTANSSASQVVSLALKGVSASAGTFTKTTAAATASQQITGVTSIPRLVMLASVNNTATTSVVAHSRFGFGASDATTPGSLSFQDTDGLNPSSTDGVDRNIVLFQKLNNNTQTDDAEATVSSFDNGGFTLSWGINDAVATEFGYLALGERRVIIVGSAR